MSTVLCSTRTVSLFICCMVLLLAGCSKQALEGPAPSAPLPTTSPILPPYLLANTWDKLSWTGIQVNPAPSFSPPFVVNDQLHVLGDWVFYQFNAGQATWNQVGSDIEFKNARYLFSYQSKAYFLKFGKYLKAYDVNTKTWTDKANYPGAETSAGAYTATASKGYLMGGSSGVDANLNPVLHSENWEYDFVNDTWTKRANTPGWPRYRSCSFAVGDKIYYGTGETVITKVQLSSGIITKTPTPLKDWWEYNTVTNTWTQKADFGGGVRCGLKGFVLKGKVYAGAGDLGVDNTLTHDLWRYDPGSNSWFERKYIPVLPDPWNRLYYVGTSGAGYATTSKVDQVWQYHP